MATPFELPSSHHNFITTHTFDSCLGCGSFGIVLRAINESRKATAIKFIFLTELDSKEQQQMRRECKITRELQPHENVVNVIDVAETQFTAAELQNTFATILNTDKQHDFVAVLIAKTKRYNILKAVWLHMELCGEDLRQWLSGGLDGNNESVQLKQVMIVKNTIVGLKYLHYQKIIHRDLKPENIMFAKTGYQLPVKIGDFGLCREIHSEDTQTSTLTSRAGTADYMAPEAFSNKYSFQADLFSLGLVIWEVAQLIPFQNRKTMFDRLVNDMEEKLVSVHPRMSVVRDSIIGLTKRNTRDRTQTVDEVSEVAEWWGQDALTPKNSEELKMCLKYVSKGGTIQLANCEYVGPFILKQDNVEVYGVEGSSLKWTGEGDLNAVGLKIKGCDCKVSGVAIDAGIGNTNLGIGIVLQGENNQLSDIKFTGGGTPLEIVGDGNHLQNLNISNSDVGINILGCNNTVDCVEMENIMFNGIYVASNKNSLSNITGRNVSHGILVHGSHNNIYNVTMIKNSQKPYFYAVSLNVDNANPENNRVRNLTCSGYEMSKNDWGLRILAKNSSAENSDCGPIWISGNATLTNIQCRDLITVVGVGVKLIKCRGKKLEASKEVNITECNFDVIVGNVIENKNH